MKQPITFNVNEKVRVRLTDLGRRIHREEHEEFLRSVGEAAARRMPYRPPQVDADGFSEFQLWGLMELFGPHMRIGFDPPFEPTILLLP